MPHASWTQDTHKMHSSIHHNHCPPCDITQHMTDVCHTVFHCRDQQHRTAHNAPNAPPRHTPHHAHMHQQSPHAICHIRHILIVIVQLMRTLCARHARIDACIARHCMPHSFHNSPTFMLQSRQSTKHATAMHTANQCRRKSHQRIRRDELDETTISALP